MRRIFCIGALTAGSSPLTWGLERGFRTGLVFQIPLFFLMRNYIGKSRFSNPVDPVNPV
jgi:hypothetical protein